MEVIGHEAPRMQPPAGFNAGLTQSFNEAPAVGVILEDQFPAIAPVHDMVNCSGILQA